MAIMSEEKSFISLDTPIKPTPPQFPLFNAGPATPYLQLMRLDRPHAALFFYLPLLLGSLQEATFISASSAQLLQINSVLLLWTFCFRGAMNSWNDILDVDIDRKVFRTRQRPLARGAISVRQGFVFFLFLIVCCLGMLVMFDSGSRFMALIWLGLGLIYPATKRFMNCPQIYFGLGISLGIVFGVTATHGQVTSESISLLGLTQGKMSLGISPSSFIDVFRHRPTPLILSVVFLYCAHTTWALDYEIIYSYQDVEDDAEAGVGNIALLMPRKGKVLLFGLAIATSSFICLSGFYMNAGPSYFILAVSGSAASLLSQIAKVNLRDPASCATCFRMQGITTGLALVTGFASQYVSVRLGML